MTTPERPQLDDLSLDALFAEAKQDAVPSGALMERITANAAALAVSSVQPERAMGLWARMMDAVGGWPSVSGLATAAVAGVYIGYSDPTLLETVGLSETTEVSTDLLFNDDMYFEDVTVGEG